MATLDSQGDRLRSRVQGRHTLDDWFADPHHPVSAIFLRDLLDGWYRERNYDATNYSPDQEAPIVTEYRLRWLDEPERTRVLLDSDL